MSKNEYVFYCDNCNDENHTPTTTSNYHQCHYSMIGVFICVPSSNSYKFKPLYELHEQGKTDGCCIKKVSCVDPVYVDMSNICVDIDYDSIYKIVYKLPYVVDNCTNNLLKIINVTKLCVYNFEGVIKRYSVCSTDLYFIELDNKHQVRILNPEKLMPTKNYKVSNHCMTGSCLTLDTNNYTYYSKVILQGASFDDVTDCDCDVHYMHLYSISYYGRRCA